MKRSLKCLFFSQQGPQLVHQGRRPLAHFVIRLGNTDCLVKYLADLARLYANPFDGGAICLPAGYGPTLTGPAVWISKEDGDRLAANPESKVSLIVKGRFAEGSQDANIIGTLPGTSSDKVIVCAHHDSVWNGPGIIDNASGAEAVRRVLATMAGRDHELTLEGCVFGAEELGLLGSRFYVTEAKLRSELSRVRAVVNIDAIGHGPRLVLQATAGPLNSVVEELAIKHRLGRFAEVVIGPPGPGSDHYPFALEGIPSVAVVQFPYPQYHQPLEPAGLLDPEAFETELAFITELTEALLSGTMLSSKEGVPERTTPWRPIKSQS